MRLKCLKVYPILFLTILSLDLHSQKPDGIDDNVWTEVNTKIDEFMAEGNVPAISIGLVKNGRIYFINRGNFSRETDRKIDENAVFQTASISKMLTSVMINALLIKGDLTLNESIVTHLPKDYPEKTIEKLSPITIRDVLHHRSGLPGSTKTYRKNRKGNTAFIYNYTEDDFKRDLISVKLKSRAGAKYYYSNFGYALLGYIAELATQKPYEQLLKENLRTPYDLESTSSILLDSSKLVTAYRKDKRKVRIEPWVMGKLTPPSGLFSSTKDLAHLMLSQIEAYRNGNISSLVLTEDTRPCQPESGISYGFGFRVYGASGFYGHGGEMDGFAGDYTINPIKNAGHVILTSCSGDEVYELSGTLSGLLY